MLDGLVLSAFVLGAALALGGRGGRAWPAVVAIVTLLPLGVRGLYLLEVPAPSRAAWFLALFVGGLLVVARAVRRSRQEP